MEKTIRELVTEDFPSTSIQKHQQNVKISVNHTSFSKKIKTNFQAPKKTILSEKLKTRPIAPVSRFVYMGVSEVPPHKKSTSCYQLTCKKTKLSQLKPVPTQPHLPYMYGLHFAKRNQEHCNVAKPCQKRPRWYHIDLDQYGAMLVIET